MKPHKNYILILRPIDYNYLNPERWHLPLVTAGALLATCIGHESISALRLIGARRLPQLTTRSTSTPDQAHAALVVLVAGVAWAAHLVVVVSVTTAGCALAEVATVEVAGRVALAVPIAARLPHTTAFACVVAGSTETVLALVARGAQRAPLDTADVQHAIPCTPSGRV